MNVVNWDLIENYMEVFPSMNDVIFAFKVNGNRYCDKEINEQLPNLSLPNFNVTTWSQNPQVIEFQVPSYSGYINGICLKWFENPNNRIEFIYLGYDDWIFIIQQDKKFLASAILGCHPAVFTNTFLFANSDGSTFINMNPRDYLNANQLLEYMIKLTHDFLYHQIH